MVKVDWVIAMSAIGVNYQVTGDDLIVKQGKVVTVEYSVFDADSGNLLEQRNDLIYLHGGKEKSLPKLREALAGLRVNHQAEVFLSAAEAFGEYDQNLLLNESVESIPVPLRKVGARFKAENELGELLIFRVIRIENDIATLDGNHPLVGRQLKFQVKVRAIRDATKLELEQGYALGFSPFNGGTVDKIH